MHSQFERKTEFPHSFYGIRNNHDNFESFNRILKKNKYKDQSCYLIDVKENNSIQNFQNLNNSSPKKLLKNQLNIQNENKEINDLFPKINYSFQNINNNLELNEKKIEKKNNFMNFINNQNFNSNNQVLKNSNISSQNKNEQNRFTKNFLKNIKNNGLEYTKMIKDCHDTQKNKFLYLIPNSKVISKQMLESDIFFSNEKFNQRIHLYNNENSKKKSFGEKKNIHDNINNDSDIFLLKRNQISNDKIGEKYLLKENKEIYNKYNISSRSNSEWYPKIHKNGVINLNSTNYDILNPMLKIKNFDNEFLDKSKVNNIKKSISEFNDLSRVYVPNNSKNYLIALNNNEKSFRKNINVCDSYNNLSKMYNNICEKPFVKKIT